MGKTANLTTLKFSLELLRRIPSTRRITVSELKQQLDAVGEVRAKRTIREQLEALAELCEIERDDARPVGYRRICRDRSLDVAQMCG